MDGCLTPAACVEGLRACYGAFLEQSNQIAQKTGLREVLAHLVGKPKAQNTLTAQLHQELPGWIDSLTQSLPTCPAENASAIAAQVMEDMLLYPIPSNESIEFSLISVEQFSQPLIVFLAKPALEDLIAHYKQHSPPRRMLPNQSKLLKSMETRLKEL